MRVETLSRDPDVRCLRLRRVEAAFASPFDGAGFALLLVAGGAVPSEARNRFADAVVAAGCRYACCAGVDCEAWHDTIDEACVALDVEAGSSALPLVVTTWHDGASPGEAAFFFLRCTQIDDAPPAHRLVVLLGVNDEQAASEAAAITAELGG